MLRSGEVLIHRGNAHQFINPVVDGEQKYHGLKPRDWVKHPCGSMPGVPRSDVTKIPRSEWSQRIKDMRESKSLLSDIRNTGMFGAMIPSRDQNGRGYSHTADTEVLTENGWKLWPDWNGKDLLATVNLSTHLMEFQAPTERHAYEYNDEMYYSTNRRLDFGVTRNHRMIVRKWDERLRTLSPFYTEQRADQLGWYVGMMDAPRGFIGTDLVELAVDGDRHYDGDDFLAMLSLVCSDGYAGGSDSTRDQVSFCCFREDQHERINALAYRVGFKEQANRRGVWNRYGAGNLAQWIRTNCYTDDGLKAPNKRVPDIVKVASMRQIKHFLDFFGDKNHSGSQSVFYSSSKRMIDDLQELHLRIGKRGTITSRDPRSTVYQKTGQVISGGVSYILNVAKADRLCVERKKHIETDRYKGLVYCATVPNGTLVTRRNGSVLISGNCWAHSTVSAAVLTRAANNQPYADLSAYAIACIIKGYADEGGWNGESMQFLRERGCPTSKTWQQQSVSRSNDNPNTWAEAALYKDTEWDDIPDRDFDQLFTYLLLRVACPMDENWWSHSICGADPVDGATERDITRMESGKLATVNEFDYIWEVNEGGGYGVRIWNSWGDSWSDNGMGVLTESKATPDGSIALRVMRAAA